MNSKTTTPTRASARPAEIVREYGPFEGEDRVNGVTHDGRQVWASVGAKLLAFDPASGQPWPAMPAAFRELARLAASEGGFPGFEPDACLINRYLPGAKMSLHQDKDEKDYAAPIQAQPSSTCMNSARLEHSRATRSPVRRPARCSTAP